MDGDEIYYQDKSILGEERETGILEAYQHFFTYFFLPWLCITYVKT